MTLLFYIIYIMSPVIPRVRWFYTYIVREYLKTDKRKTHAPGGLKKIHFSIKNDRVYLPVA